MPRLPQVSSVSSDFGRWRSEPGFGGSVRMEKAPRLLRTRRPLPIDRLTRHPFGRILPQMPRGRLRRYPGAVPPAGIRTLTGGVFVLVPTARLELAQLSPLPPQDSVSTNFTTSARGYSIGAPVLSTPGAVPAPIRTLQPLLHVCCNCRAGLRISGGPYTASDCTTYCSLRHVLRRAVRRTRARNRVRARRIATSGHARRLARGRARRN